MIMRRSGPLLSLAAGIALIAGCAQSQTGDGSSGVVPQVVRASRASAFRQSWMDASAAGRDLLYVTNIDGVVNVYRYWQHTLAGVLTSFDQPEGECVDDAGHVYIADFGAKKVFEYAHGGKSPIRAIDTSPYSAFGCAVSPRNGNLAIANYWSNGQDGNVEILRHAKGKPVIYTDPYIVGFQSLAYDAKGNLLATDGNGYTSSYEGSEFDYLPKNGIKLIEIELCRSSSCTGLGTFVQGIQWDGKYWVLGSGSSLSRWTIADDELQYVDEITLDNAYESQLGPFWLYRANPQAPVTQVVGASTFESRSAVFYWHYPAGGDSVGSVTKDLDVPYGVVGSLKP